MIKLEIQGVSELKKSLMRLSKKELAEAGNAAVTTAVLPTVIKMKQLAPKDTGALRASVGVRFRKYRKGSLFYAVIGARYDDISTPKGKKVPGFYAHLVEFGHVPYRGKGFIGPSQKVGMRPWIRPAWAATKSQVLADLSMVFGAKVIEAAERVRKRRARK